MVVSASAMAPSAIANIRAVKPCRSMTWLTAAVLSATETGLIARRTAILL